MQLDIVQLDISKTQERWPPGVPFEPAYVHRFKPGESHNWLVLDSPLDADQPPQWASPLKDDYIRVPLFPYMLNPEADLALAFMLQLGLSCATHMPKQVVRLLVVTGQPVELLYDPDTDVNTGIRYWVGFAVITEK